MELFNVLSPSGDLLMTAPMESVRRVLLLRVPAVERIETELLKKGKAVSAVHFNGRGCCFNFDNLVIERYDPATFSDVSSGARAARMKAREVR